MKKLFFIFGFSTVFLGCATLIGPALDKSVKERFSKEFNCPVESISTKELGGESAKAEGCNKSQVYSCQKNYGMASYDYICKKD